MQKHGYLYAYNSQQSQYHKMRNSDKRTNEWRHLLPGVVVVGKSESESRLIFNSATTYHHTVYEFTLCFVLLSHGSHSFFIPHAAEHAHFV